MGKGTGLGLATIYGIVKQNGGFIDVYSEVGLGTSFKIYLPRIAGASGDLTSPGEVQARSAGGASILVIEDDEVLCQATRRMLESMGYTAVAVQMPDEAVAIVKQGTQQFDLLLVDVVMPGLNGVEVAACVLELQPGMRVLYMSGYTAEAIVHRGVLNEGVHFLQKPFSSSELAEKIREVLG